MAEMIINNCYVPILTCYVFSLSMYRCNRRRWYQNIDDYLMESSIDYQLVIIGQKIDCWSEEYQRICTRNCLWVLIFKFHNSWIMWGALLYYWREKLQLIHSMKAHSFEDHRISPFRPYFITFSKTVFMK